MFSSREGNVIVVHAPLYPARLNVTLLRYNVNQSLETKVYTYVVMTKPPVTQVKKNLKTNFQLQPG